MNNIFFISDSHHNHKNVLKFEDRPFKDVEEMNEKLIEYWNSVVTKSDKVFFCGDFGFGSQEGIKKIVSRLIGNKVLIMGNHDKRKSVKWWLDVGFKEVIKYPIIWADKFILSHEPLQKVPEGYINIHGHLHSKVIDDRQYFNVSCELLNYTPISFKELLSEIFSRIFT